MGPARHPDLPQRRAAGLGNDGCPDRLTEAGEDVAHGRGVGKEGDDPDFATALRAQEWKTESQRRPTLIRQNFLAAERR